MIQIWIRSSTGNLRLPVLPEKITLEDGGLHEIVVLQDLGEALIPGKRKLRGMQVESYFPARYDRNCNYANIPDPQQAVEMCQGWAQNAELLRLIITGGSVTVNMQVVLETFTATAAKLPGDVSYTMIFKERRALVAKRVQASVMRLHPRPTVRTVVPAPRPRNRQAPPANPDPAAGTPPPFPLGDFTFLTGSPFG